MSSAAEDSNSDESLVMTGKRDRVTGFRVPDFQYSALGRLILFRLLNDRDMKIIITSSGSTTGTGKTTLAIHLSRWIRQVSNELLSTDSGWNAEEYSHMDLYEYFKGYKRSKAGDAILLDEIEYAADRRRSMSHENVKLSQAWSILRYKNVATVSTLPTVTMLDSRLMELADVWINVIYPGRANTYYLTVDDFNGHVIRKRLKHDGYRESIMWDKIPESDADYDYLKNEKRDLGIPGLDDSNNVTVEDLKDAKREVKKQAVIKMLQMKQAGELQATQADIGDVVSWSQQNVAKIKRESDEF